MLLDRGAPAGEDRIDAAVADNVTAAMQPIAAYSRGHNLAGGRLSASKTGTAQLGDTGANKDAWMVGYTPSLSTAVWVGTPDGEAITNSGGAMIYGSGLPSDIWEGHDGRRPRGHRQREVPDAGQDQRSSRWCSGVHGSRTAQDVGAADHRTDDDGNHSAARGDNDAGRGSAGHHDPDSGASPGRRQPRHRYQGQARPPRKNRQV